MRLDIYRAERDSAPPQYRPTSEHHDVLALGLTIREAATFLDDAGIWNGTADRQSPREEIEQQLRQWVDEEPWPNDSLMWLTMDGARAFRLYAVPTTET